MKKYTKFLLFLLVSTGLIAPVIPSVVAQSAPLRFSIGIGGYAQDWDPITYGGLSSVLTYSTNALESLVYEDKDFAGQNEQYIPILATDWDIEFWPEEVNALNLTNKEGIKSIEFTLRSGVTFHDGSNWNATVAKWNIDRFMVGNGNLTGTGPKKWKHIYYVEALEWEDYFTASWNLTEFDGKMPVYGEFDACADETMRDFVPIINNCTITQDLESGGKINITSNHWNADLLGTVGEVAMISMQAYEDYFDTGIYGYGNDPVTPQPAPATIEAGNYPSTGFPGHMIGTGCFRFVIHDESASPAGGYMVKNEDWWGAASVEARGGWIVDYFDVVWFPYDAGGEATRNTALVTGELDIAFHLSTAELVYNDVMNSSYVEWYDTTLDPNLNIVSFNCIEDWSIPNASLPTYGSSYDKGIRSGVPRAFRKALSYAFDYDTYINAAKQGRAARLRYPLGGSSTYYNDSLPYVTYDLDVARQALIDGGIAPPEATGWTDSQWKQRAANNPLYVFNYAWDDAHEDVNNEIFNALERIGCNYNRSAEWKFDPYCFYHIYTSMFFGGTTWPFYTVQGFNMKWPWPDTQAAGYIRAMLRSGEYWNLGFSYNDTADQWIDQMTFAGPSEMQDLQDRYCTWFNTYQYAYLLISQDKNGYAINVDYELDYVYEGTYQLPARIMLAPATPPPFIPGFSVPLLGLIAVTSIALVAYKIKKRRG